MDAPKTFCSLAWVHRFTNIGGEIQVCCSSEEKDNNIRADDGRPMSIAETASDEQIMNSRYMKEVRLKMLSGEWPEFCHRCEVTEKTGGTSRRNSENSRYSGIIGDLIRETAEDGTIPVRIRSADYRLGNLCNLACRMCNPRASSQWIKNWNDVDQNLFKLSPERAREFSEYDWYQKPNLMENIKTQVPVLEHLHFAGGEPLIVPEMAKILEYCVAEGHAAHIRLTYNTNITKIPEKVKRLWPRFNGVQLLCSVDGYGELNEFIRHPSSWKTIDQNLRELDRSFDEYGLSEVQIMTTSQVYNILSLDPLFDYLAENMTRVSQIPHLIDLHYPLYYRTQILPPGLKKIARERLRNILKRTQERIEAGKIPRSQSYLLDPLVGVLNFIDLEDHREAIPEFVRAAKSKDRMRGQDTFKLLPELVELEASRFMNDGD
ncbi:MAG: twitch domain-containing radical SAM protein [Oligoflexia bacterium]|nr:twitch domain-containing radical SAM protein [Oligoflexia bacterium]